MDSGGDDIVGDGSEEKGWGSEWGGYWYNGFGPFGGAYGLWGAKHFSSEGCSWWRGFGRVMIDENCEGFWRVLGACCWK